MELTKTIQTRRSIRKFKSSVPDKKIIDMVLEPIVYTPSPSNQQPLELVVITSRNKQEYLKYIIISSFNKLKRNALKSNNKKTYRYLMAYWRYITPLFSAPVIIATGLKEYKGLSNLLPINNNQKAQEIYLGASLYNITLNAHNYGLGSCIYTAPIPLLDSSITKKEFGINILAFLTLGYPDEIPKIISKKKLKEIIKYL